MPHRTDISPEIFGGDWTSCFLLDLDETVTDGSGPSGAFTHVGEALTSVSGGAARIGWTLREIAAAEDGGLLHSAVRHLAFVLSREAPFGHGGDVRLGDRLFLFRSVLLPLAGDNGSIVAILGAVNCRELVVEVPMIPSGD